MQAAHMRLATLLHCSSLTAYGQRRFRSSRRASLCPRSPRNTQTARECCLQKCIARPLHAKATVLRENLGIYLIKRCAQDDLYGLCRTSLFHCRAVRANIIIVRPPFCIHIIKWGTPKVNRRSPNCNLFTYSVTFFPIEANTMLRRYTPPLARTLIAPPYLPTIMRILRVPKPW